ncbi:Ser-Thr-rich glycosyl-phosphatidyl-inositol-anchored membrane family-domain-containing protein [Aspergillus pseudoustus]|uniref:Ser-Thr-rich glycosyl-phosphatidyl-inositol-anchored membrane family-domain-containing protein n=1 Tax=Aspergillus pseudoustus TaxID=1810923 RepID=A0ABR4K1L0_9EURO
MRATMLPSVLLLLAVAASALKVTEPKKNVEIDPSESFTVKWDSVNTDPTSFDLYLVNNAVYPPVDKKIASDVDTSQGSYSVDGVSGLSTGSGYQINLYSNEEHNTGILAQSEQFNVTASDTTSSSSSTSSTTSTHSSTSTGTSTTSTPITSSSSSTESGSSTHTPATSTASSTESTSAVASPSASHSASSNGTSDEVHDGNGAGALGAPLAVAAGILGGALLFNL